LLELYNIGNRSKSQLEVGAVMEKLKKACVLDQKCSIKSYVQARISTRAPNQNLKT